MVRMGAVDYLRGNVGLTNRVAASFEARGAGAIEVLLSGAAVLHWIKATLHHAELVAVILVAGLLAEVLAVAGQGGHPYALG